MSRRSMSAFAVIAMVVVAALGCDQLNKPIRPLRNPPPRQPAEVLNADAGEAGAPAPAPSITAEPGDVHL